jgi:hypothetical protein
VVPRPKHIKKYDRIPSLNKKNNTVTSEDDPFYNCIAFAVGETSRKWWPAFQPDYYWPPNAPKVNTIDAFLLAFETRGYAECSDGNYEEGVEKIALYARGTGPTHAARQIGPNKWASKLGDWYDIEHTPDAVSSGDYGSIVKYMKKEAQS